MVSGLGLLWAHSQILLGSGNETRVADVRSGFYTGFFSGDGCTWSLGGHGGMLPQENFEI